MATESDKLNIGAVATLVAVLALAMVAIVAILTAMVRNEMEGEVARKGGTASTRAYRDLVAEQNTVLTEEARWSDRDAGVLSIPIERSMKLVVDEIRSDPSLATALAADAGVADADNVDAADAGTDDAKNDNEESTADASSPPPAPSTAPPQPPPSPATQAPPPPPAARTPLAPSPTVPPPASAPTAPQDGPH